MKQYIKNIAWFLMLTALHGGSIACIVASFILISTSSSWTAVLGFILLLVSVFAEGVVLYITARTVTAKKHINE